MKIEDIQAKLKEKGVVGAGGAGFPTYAKLYKNPKYLIMNGAECEPLFKADQALMTNFPYEVLKGFSLLMETMDVAKGIIALKEKYKESIDALEGVLNLFKNIEIKKLKDIYPMGDEIVLIYETTGEIIPQGEIPRSKGVVVINVETSYNVYNALVKDEPVTDTFLTVSGEMENPKTFKVPIGTKVKDIFSYMDITPQENQQIMLGGPMTGNLGTLETAVTKTTKGILLLSKNKKICRARHNTYRHLKQQAFSACSQCQMCTDLCPRHHLGYDIKPHKIMNTVVYGDDYLNLLGVFSCCECNLCTLYSCHQDLNPMQIIKDLKIKLREAGLKPIKKEALPTKAREYRKIPEKSLKQRLGLISLDKKAPLTDFTYFPEYYFIDLHQNIGMSPTPMVALNDKVIRKQMIAKPGDGLSVGLHSPVDGKILEITDRYILIKSEENI